MKFVIDMNLSPRWIPLLKAAGFEARHWSDIGQVTATDEEIVAWARKSESIVVTHDLDFSAILASTKHAKPSVIQIRADDINPDRIGRRVISAITQFKAELMAGAVISVDPVRARVRVLPLER
jgi:predicted nuclease of predicted toxin-antitoxin system